MTRYRHDPEILTVKKSPIIMVRDFILLEIAGYVVFLFIGTLAFYGEIYRSLSFAEILPFHAAELFFIIGFQILSTLYIFFRWFYEYLQISPQEIRYARGVLFRKKSVWSLRGLHPVSHEEGPLGKMFHYGTLVLEEHATSREWRISYIPTPHMYAEYIRKLQRGGFGTTHKVLDAVGDIAELISQGEHERLEFKATFRWDIRAGRINKQLEKVIMKTVAAFLNTDGGRLVIGVEDSGKAVGLFEDYQTLQRQDRDGFENHFTLVFNGMLGAEFRQFIKLHLTTYEGKDICVVEVTPSTRPVYLRFENSEEFYIRTGNTTTALKLSEVASYIDLWQEAG